MSISERVWVRYGKRCSLANCPPGLFVFDGAFGIKTEYGAIHAKKPYDPQNVMREMTSWPDAYCLDSGEVFWGGVTTHEERAKLKVTPAEILL